jgi:hypothetical protein
MIVGRALLERADSTTKALLRMVTHVGDLDMCQHVRSSYVHGDVFNRASVSSVKERICDECDWCLGVDISSPSFCEFGLGRGKMRCDDRSGGRVYGKTA